MIRYTFVTGIVLVAFSCLIFSFSLLAWEDESGAGGGVSSSAKPVAKQAPLLEEQAAAPPVNDIVDHCERLAEMDKPSKGCDCLYEAYQTALDRNEKQKFSLYEHWKKQLDEAENKLMSNSNPSALSMTQNFCENYYGNPDNVKIEANSSTRDRAVMVPQLKNKEEHTAFINEGRELKVMTQGASEIYCRAFFEVRAYERIMNANPLAGKSPQAAYNNLKNSSFCRSRLR